MGGVVCLTGADHGAACAWVVPTYKNARPVWRFIQQMAAGAPGVRVRKSDRSVEFSSGGWVSIYSGDNDVALRGEAFDILVVDEAAQMREETWTDVLMPTLADRSGKAFLVSTPKGRNWFWREWTTADGDASVAYQYESKDNPMESIQRASDAAKDRVTERTYRQEWLAEFVEDGGGVFRHVRAAVDPSVQQGGSDNGASYSIGCDWGRTNDATVFAVVDLDTGTCVEIDRMLRTDYQTQVRRLRAMWERYGSSAQIIAESNAMGGPIVETLQNDGLPVTPFATTVVTKPRIIDGLALAFEKRDITILDEPVLIDELEAFEGYRMTSGAMRYKAPEGTHDDCVIALALAWSAKEEAGPLILGSVI